MTFPNLFKREVADEYSQTNFQRVSDFFAADALTRCGFEFISCVVPGAVTNAPVVHRLGYAPKDVILMHNLNNAAVTFNYGLFDATTIYVTTNAATTLRMLVGRYL